MKKNQVNPVQEAFSGPKRIPGPSGGQPSVSASAKISGVLPFLAAVLAISATVFFLAFNGTGGILFQPLDVAGTVGNELLNGPATSANTGTQLSENQETMLDHQDFAGSGWETAVTEPVTILTTETAVPAASESETTAVTTSESTDETTAETTKPSSEPTAAPSQETAEPAQPDPTPYPRVLDALGIPQEGMPVEDFNLDDTIYYVKVNQANLRESPDTSCPILARLTMGDPVTRKGYGLDWSKVETPSGKSGYILTSLLSRSFIAKPTPTPRPTPSPTPKPTPSAAPSPTAAPTPSAAPSPTAEPTPEPTTEQTAAPTLTPAPSPAAAPTPSPYPACTSLSEEQKQVIISLARSLIGTRYVYASMNPAVGFDCSGFTSYVYKVLFAVKLPRSARDQAGAGIEVSSSEIQVGDIICFDWFNSDGICDHVGLYIGGGKYIHASSSDRTYYPDSGAVKESTVVFGKNPVVSIRRIIHG
jgi:cell wall-associated NlpC family hydrolase